MTVEQVEAKQEENNEVLEQIKQLSERVNALQDENKTLQDENKTLKSFAEQTIQEKRDIKAKTEQALLDKEKELAEKSSRTKDESEQLIKQYKGRVEALEKDKQSYQEKEYNNKVNAKALELAQTLAAKNPEKAKLLAKEFKSRIKIDEDGSVKVLDENGNMTISPVDSLVNDFGSRYAFLCDGIESTGGGSHSSGGAQARKLSEMNEPERIALYKKDPEQYRELANKG